MTVSFQLIVEGLSSIRLNLIMLVSIMVHMTDILLLVCYVNKKLKYYGCPMR